ncbi:glycosyltransferase, partial [Escherichia coli]
KFYRVVLIENSVNKGVSENCNIGWKACTSNWIKSIGGDDLLSVDCLEKNHQFILSNPECRIVFSKMEWFGRITKITPEPYNIPFFNLSAHEQYYYLMFKSFNIAPTSYIHRGALADIGYADRKYTLIEDLPLWLKFTSNNYKLYFFSHITVKYRVQNSTSKHASRYINIPFLQQLIEIDSCFKFRDMPTLYYKALKIDAVILMKGKLLISKITNNRVCALSKILDIVHFLLRPVYILRKIYRSYINYIAIK